MRIAPTHFEALYMRNGWQPSWPGSKTVMRRAAMRFDEPPCRHGMFPDDCAVCGDVNQPREVNKNA